MRGVPRPPRQAYLWCRLKILISTHLACAAAGRVRRADRGLSLAASLVLSRRRRVRLVVCRVFDVVASPRVPGSRYPETVPRQSLFDVQQGRPSGAAKPTGVKFRIQTSFRAPQITPNCTDGLARRRGREVLETESMSAMRPRGTRSARRDSWTRPPSRH